MKHSTAFGFFIKSQRPIFISLFLFLILSVFKSNIYDRVNLIGVVFAEGESCSLSQINKCNYSSVDPSWTTCPVGTWCQCTAGYGPGDPNPCSCSGFSTGSCSESGTITLDQYINDTEDVCDISQANRCNYSSVDPSWTTCPVGTWCQCTAGYGPGDPNPCSCSGFSTGSCPEGRVVTVEQFMGETPTSTRTGTPGINYNGPIISDVSALLAPIARILFFGGLGIGVMFLVYSGYLLMTSQGDPKKVQEGQEQLTSAVVGILFIVLSGVLLRVIINSILGGESLI